VHKIVTNFQVYPKFFYKITPFKPAPKISYYYHVMTDDRWYERQSNNKLINMYSKIKNSGVRSQPRSIKPSLAAQQSPTMQSILVELLWSAVST